MELEGNSYFRLLPLDELDEKISKVSNPFSATLFWDTVIDNVNLIQHKDYFIERVITRGALEDIYCMVKLYSSDDIILSLRKSKVLDKKTINFCNLFFKSTPPLQYVTSFYN